MKEKFREWSPHGDTVTLLNQMKQVINHYQELQIRMTLRQLFYQIVARNLIPNTDKSYKKLSEMLTRARMAGYVDWDAIEDRVRIPYRHGQWDSIEDLITSALEAFRYPRHHGQPNYIEMFMEKDAIYSVLKPIADELHIRMSVNRGYTSASAMYDSAHRFAKAVRNGQNPVLLYLGDHDSSGLDMDRDIQTRLNEFGVEIDFVRVGLTDAQISQYNPPPNPTKITDPRARDYIARYGNTCWEVDALPPEVLNQIVRNAIIEQMNMELYNQMIAAETAGIEHLEQVRDDWIRADGEDWHDLFDDKTEEE